MPVKDIWERNSTTTMYINLWGTLENSSHVPTKKKIIIYENEKNSDNTSSWSTFFNYSYLFSFIDKDMKEEGRGGEGEGSVQRGNTNFIHKLDV